jgi:hypothetical protein
MLLAEIRAFNFIRPGDEVPEPEDEGAVVNQRRAEKVQRLVQFYSAMDLTGLPPRQRVQQEQKMRSMYGAQSEGWLDKSLAAAKQLQERTPPRPTESLAAAKQLQERTPPRPTEDEDIVLQVRRGLSMRKMARLRDSHVVKQLLGIKARATKQTQDTLEYLEWLPDDDQTRPISHVKEHAGDGAALIWQTPLDELHARLTQLIGEVEYLHGASTSESTPGAPWLLLRGNSDMLNAGQPTNYDNSYIDLMRTYRDAARTAMSIADAASKLLLTQTRLRNRGELQYGWNPPYGFTRDSIPIRGLSSRP